MLIFIVDDRFQLRKARFVGFVSFGSLVFILLEHLDDKGVAKQSPKQFVRENFELVRLYFLAAVAPPGPVMPQLVPRESRDDFAVGRVADEPGQLLINLMSINFVLLES